MGHSCLPLEHKVTEIYRLTKDLYIIFSFHY